MKDEVAKPLPQQDTQRDIALTFPLMSDFLISGVLNPIRFLAPSAQEVDVKLYNFNQDTLLAQAQGLDEVWLQIPKVNIETKFKLLIQYTVFEVKVITMQGEPISLKQYEKQLGEGKTIAVVNTNNIPFAFKQNANQSFTAFDMTCTHNGCPIELDVSNKFQCGCHGSTFDEEGKVTNGPANEPLRTFAWQYFLNHKVVVVQNR
ncbi:MAG: Rieske 2Fe-2S domain-containing protein [Bacteroidia bacterium]|nr:Rieske 2Fe-2S domain-containing protein [Bacteroidia bacterium]